MGLSPDTVEVRVMGVRVLLASGGPGGDVARRTARGTAVYGGDADDMAHEEIIDFLYGLVCALAGATGAPSARRGTLRSPHRDRVPSVGATTST